VKSDSAIGLDIIARRYGQRPSVVMGLNDPYLAYCFDEAIALRGLLFERPPDSEIQPMRRGAPQQQSLQLGPFTLMGKLGGRVGDY
jgi:hypothetical protein